MIAAGVSQPQSLQYQHLSGYQYDDYSWVPDHQTHTNMSTKSRTSELFLPSVKTYYLLFFRILVKTKDLDELKDKIKQTETREPRFRQLIPVNTDIAKFKEIRISAPFEVLIVHMSISHTVDIHYL